MVGAGGLGAPVAWMLAQAGIGTIGLADPDCVELSNLNRQILYCQADIGSRKVEAAQAALQSRFPGLRVEAYPLRVEVDNANDLFRAFDFIVDATDGVDSKYIVNDAAVLNHKALAHAGVVGMGGQALTILPQRTACLRCLFPDPPQADEVPACQVAGILGPVAGAVAALQAAAAIQYLGVGGEGLGDKLLTWDARRWRWHSIVVRRSPSCPLCRDA